MKQQSIRRQSISALIGLVGVFAGSLPHAEAISLDEAYRASLTTHEHIDIAHKEVSKSKLLPNRAKSIMLPHVSLDSDYVRLDDEMDKTTRSHLSAPPFYEGDISVGPTLVAPEDQLGASLSFKQAIYRGEFFPLRNAAKHKIEHSRESLFDTTQGILFDVATVYYEGVTSKALIMTSEELLLVAQKDLEISQIKVNAGKFTEDAVHRAQLNVSRAERQLIISRQRLKLAKEILGRLTGLEQAVEEIEEPTLLVARKENFDTLLDIAYSNRFDYKIAKLNIDLAQDDLDLSKSKRHPSMNAEWKYFWYDEQPPSVDKEFWAASIKVSVPLYEGGDRTLEVREKVTTLEQARSAHTSLAKNIRLEVEQNLLAIEAQEATLANARQQVEAAKKNHEIITTRYAFGAATSLESDQAFAALSNARTQLVTETYSHQLALLTLEKALGLFNRELIEAKSAPEGGGPAQGKLQGPSQGKTTQLPLTLQKTVDLSWSRASSSSLATTQPVTTTDSGSKIAQFVAASE